MSDDPKVTQSVKKTVTFGVVSVFLVGADGYARALPGSLPRLAIANVFSAAELRMAISRQCDERRDSREKAPGITGVRNIGSTPAIDVQLSEYEERSSAFHLKPASNDAHANDDVLRGLL